MDGIKGGNPAPRLQPGTSSAEVVSQGSRTVTYSTIGITQGISADGLALQSGSCASQALAKPDNRVDSAVDYIAGLMNEMPPKSLYFFALSLKLTTSEAKDIEDNYKKRNVHLNKIIKKWFEKNIDEFNGLKDNDFLIKCLERISTALQSGMVDAPGVAFLVEGELERLKDVNTVDSYDLFMPKSKWRENRSGNERQACTIINKPCGNFLLEDQGISEELKALYECNIEKAKSVKCDQESMLTLLECYRDISYDWEAFGIELGVVKSLIDQIKSDDRSDSNVACFRDLLGLCLCENHISSFHDVLEAVSSMKSKSHSDKNRATKKAQKYNEDFGKFIVKFNVE